MSIVKRDTTAEKDTDKLTMTDVTPTAAEKSQEDYQTPTYMERLELDTEQQKRLLAEVKEEFDAIKTEREGAKLEAKWRVLNNQYEGKVEEDGLRQFNLCRRITKVKCDAVERMIVKAAWSSNPKFSITARPEFAREGGKEVCQAQEDFIDYKLDTDIPFNEPERKTVHSSVVKGTGILKIFHELKREKRRREECYDGGKRRTAIGDNREQVEINEGLEEFLKAYPNARVDYPSYVKKLEAGKEIKIVVEYEETVFNDPMPTNVDLNDFYVRIGTNGYEELKEARLIVERLRPMTWWELKKKEKQKKFYNIDELMYKEGVADGASSAADRAKKPNYVNETFKILECVYYFKLKETDEEEVKLIVWIAEDRWLVVGSILYPYYAVPCCYVPHYISKIWPGFYQPGLAEYLTDSNIAQNAILNFILEGAMIANTVTPIANPKNPVHTQFLDKRWTHGVPIESDGPIDFLNKYIGGFNHAQLLTMLEFLGRDDGDVSGVNQLLTGRESELDPEAPAAKTLALLKQSGINVEDYITCQSDAYSRIADIILQLYYQMSEEGRGYRPRPDRVVGSDPFQEISRQDMIARTNIQSNAKAFDFDAANEKMEDLSLYKLLRMEPIIARNPESVWVLLNAIVSGWSPKWRNLKEQLLPRLADFQKKQEVVIAKGVAQFLAQKLADAQAAGQTSFTDEPPVLAQQLMAVINDLAGQTMTPPDPNVVKAADAQQEAPVA